MQYGVFKNRDCTITTYDIPEKVNNVFEDGFLASNVKSAFRATSIVPFNMFIFKAADFNPNLWMDELYYKNYHY